MCGERCGTKRLPFVSKVGATHWWWLSFLSHHTIAHCVIGWWETILYVLYRCKCPSNNSPGTYKLTVVISERQLYVNWKYNTTWFSNNCIIILQLHVVSTLLGIYSAVVAYRLILTRCVFRDALLHTTVVMHGYLGYRCLPVSFDQPGPFPLNSH